MPLGSKPSLTPRASAASEGSSGSNTSPARCAASARISVAWPEAAERRAHDPLRAARRRASRPTAARRPSRKNSSAPVSDELGADRGTRRRGRRNAPHRALLLGHERHHVAHRAPERARILGIERAEHPAGLQNPFQLLPPIGDGRRDPFQAKRGHRPAGLGDRRHRHSGGDPRRQMRRARDFARRAHASGHSFRRARVGEAEHQHGRHVLGPRQHLDRELRHHRERAPGTGRAASAES